MYKKKEKIIDFWIRSESKNIENVLDGYTELFVTNQIGLLNEYIQWRYNIITLIKKNCIKQFLYLPTYF